MSQDQKLDPSYKQSREYLIASLETLMDQNNLILSRVEEMERAEMGQTSSPTSDLPTEFSDVQKQFIWDTIAETSFAASMAQDEHEHGGERSCQDCQQVAQASMHSALNQGIADAAAYYNEIPGVPELREAYELARTNAEGKVVADQDLITFVN